ncbi:MAG: DUF6051 family protein, partial [Bacteroidota bacterium]
KKEEIPIPELGVILKNIPFLSQSELIFPRDSQYYAPQLCGSKLNLNHILFEGAMERIIKMSDQEIKENNGFNYLMMYPDHQEKAPGVILLLHGMNERDWYKYLPWGQKLVEATSKAVIFFPLAFHVNRALPDWHDRRLMQEVNQKRQELFTHMADSSFSNAAMSTRLHFAPARFFLSGLETYQDIIQWVMQLRQGGIPQIDKDARLDFFGYSAGAFLAQILMMANRDQLFEDSRAIFFCGGCLLNRMYLQSKYIMDSEAYRAILNYYVEDFDRNLQDDANLRALFDSTQTGGIYFRSLLSEGHSQANQIRKKRLEELKNQLFALSLANDDIMPSAEIQASLIGLRGNSVVPVEVMDFPYKYSHMNPFPNTTRSEEAIDQGFEDTFKLFSDFLNG